jgi:hypothetical protein
MRASGKEEGGCWPTPEQGLLLKAALLRGKEATEAWQEWRSRVNIQILDRGSLRLLPLLYRNLHMHGIDDPLMNKFKGIYRFTWYKNQMLFQTMKAPLLSFHRAGIRTLLFKGAALILLYYRDLGLRPMDDFDVLVPTERAFQTIHLLQRLGWRPLRTVPDSAQWSFLFACHGTPFEDEAGRNVDLHWHLLDECTGEKADEDFWAAATATEFEKSSVYVLNPADELLNICVHGARWNDVPPLRWAADAMMILDRSKSSLDWHRLTAQVEQRRLVLPLRAALHYLRDEMGAPVPPQTLETLDQMRASRLEQSHFEALIRPHRPVRRLRRHYLNYRRQFDRAASMRPPVGFLNYLRHRWGLAHLWELPLYAIARLLPSNRQTFRPTHDGGGFSHKRHDGYQQSRPGKV